MSPSNDRTDDHRDHITALAADDGPLTTASPHASLNNREWFRRVGGQLEPRPARRDLHDRLLADFEGRTPHVQRKRQAIVLAGPPGAGKSTALGTLVEATGTKPEHWRVINADDFKDDLLDEALADGSYDRHLVPPEVAALEAAGERFYPRELASLVHQESGMLAERARDEAIERGDNLVIDGTLSHERSADRLMKQLVDAGYEIRIAAVEAPRDVVEARIVSRWRDGYLAAEHGTAVHERDARLGGRWVPSSFTASLYPPGRPEESVCGRIAQGVAERHTAVRQIDRYNVPAPDSAPQLVERRGRVGSSAALLDSETYQAMVTAQTARPGADPSRPRRHETSRTQQDHRPGRD